MGKLSCEDVGKKIRSLFGKSEAQKKDVDGFLDSATIGMQTPGDNLWSDGVANSLWYIASPFSDEDPAVQRSRWDAIRGVVVGMIKKYSSENVVPFSPVLYTVALQDFCEPPQGWYRFDLYFLDKCDVLKVVQLPGWEKSLGIQLEIAYALGKGIPIDYVDPQEYLGE